LRNSSADTCQGEDQKEHARVTRGQDPMALQVLGVAGRPGKGASCPGTFKAPLLISFSLLLQLCFTVWPSPDKEKA